MSADRNPWPRSKGRPGSALQTNVRPLGGLVDAELDTLATALYVKIDDALKDNPGLAPRRPAVGICPKLSDAELLTLCVLQALGGSSPTPGSFATPGRICSVRSPTCRASPATTSGRARRFPRSRR